MKKRAGVPTSRSGLDGDGDGGGELGHWRRQNEPMNKNNADYDAVWGMSLLFDWLFKTLVCECFTNLEGILGPFSIVIYIVAAPRV